MQKEGLVNMQCQLVLRARRKDWSQNTSGIPTKGNEAVCLQLRPQCGCTQDRCGGGGCGDGQVLRAWPERQLMGQESEPPQGTTVMTHSTPEDDKAASTLCHTLCGDLHKAPREPQAKAAL